MDILNLVEEGKVKRVFRARNKLSFPRAICHITQRAGGKEPLFLEDADYLYMLHLLKTQSKRFELNTFAYVLMPNHLHLLFRLLKDNLSTAMKQLFGEYARFFNLKYKRKGHVFGGPFRQAVCFDTSYFIAASVYIHLNPVKANLAQNPEQYRWSSCKLYTSPFKGQTFMDYKFLLELLDKNPECARRVYKELFANSVKIESYEVWEQPKAVESFKSQIMPFLPKLKKTDKIEQANLFDDQELENTIIELRQKGRLRSPETFKARKFLIEQLRSRGYSIKMIAEMLDMSRQTIYLILQK